MQAFPSSVLELLKIRLQTTSKIARRYSTKPDSSLLSLAGEKREANLYAVFQHIIKTQGIRGLSRGLHATIWRDTFTYGNSLSAHEFSRLRDKISLVCLSMTISWNLQE